MKEETPKDAPNCGSCKKEIKGAQYRIEDKDGKKIWACERCYLK